MRGYLPIRKQGEFCFLPIFCKICNKKIELNPIKIGQYLRGRFPTYHQICYNERLITYRTPKYKSKESKNKEIFYNVPILIVENKLTLKIEISKPIIKNPIIQIPTDEQDKIKIAIDRLNAQRLQRVESYEIEASKRPKEKIHNNFGMVMCISENKLIKKCSRTKFCQHWKLCHPKD